MARSATRSTCAIPVVNNAYLGYYVAAEVETVWFHATRVLRSERLAGGGARLIAATNDPLGHRLEVTITPGGAGDRDASSRGSSPAPVRSPGSATLVGRRVRGRCRASATSASASARTRSTRAAGACSTGPEEGPFSSGDAEEFLRQRLPDFTFPTGPTATNFPIPWLVSTRGLGFLIDQPERSAFNLRNNGRADSWQAETETSRFRFSVFAGPSPAAVLKRYSDSVGRQPKPLPWVFGPWFQPTAERRPFELTDRFRREDVPVSVAQTYTHYLPCGAQSGRDGAERERAAGYHARGLKVTTYFNPHVCTSYSPIYDEARQNGWLVQERRRPPLPA